MASIKAHAETYRRAALDQIEAARLLWEAERYTTAQYLAGLGAECMLRAYAARLKTEFDERHNLERLYLTSRLRDRVSPSQSAELGAALGTLFVQWRNDQRYYDLQMLRAYFRRQGLMIGIKGDVIKALTKRTVDSSWVVVTIGELLWMQSGKK